MRDLLDDEIAMAAVRVLHARGYRIQEIRVAWIILQRQQILAEKRKARDEKRVIRADQRDRGWC